MSAASRSPSSSVRSASGARSKTPTVPQSDDDDDENDEESMYQLRIKHREALQNVEQYFLTVMSQIWSQYLDAYLLNGHWPYNDTADLVNALSSRKAQPKIVNELKLLGYEDMFDDGHLVHDTFKDINLSEVDINEMDNFVRCHMYYTFVIMKRLRKKQKTAVTRRDREAERERTETAQEARNDAVFAYSLGGTVERPRTPENEWGGF